VQSLGSGSSLSESVSTVSDWTRARPNQETLPSVALFLGCFGNESREGVRDVEDRVLMTAP